MRCRVCGTGLRVDGRYCTSCVDLVALTVACRLLAQYKYQKEDTDSLLRIMRGRAREMLDRIRLPGCNQDQLQNISKKEKDEIQ